MRLSRLQKILKLMAGLRVRPLVVRYSARLMLPPSRGSWAVAVSVELAEAGLVGAKGAPLADGTWEEDACAWEALRASNTACNIPKPCCDP